ncbi:MAG: hypothetical protein C4K47_08895 [Candidatus Thorarchaeota archaeon]|nr:MAG: hypothetical protein C4K47_08895 [Candidatus Thorarchaeota archaeon]
MRACREQHISLNEHELRILFPRITKGKPDDAILKTNAKLGPVSLIHPVTYLSRISSRLASETVLKRLYERGLTIECLAELEIDARRLLSDLELPNWRPVRRPLLRVVSIVLTQCVNTHSHRRQSPKLQALQNTRFGVISASFGNAN